MSNTTDHRIAEIGNEMSPTTVTLRESGVVRFIEFRICRRNKDTQELVPTNWAIGLDAGTYSELKVTLEELDENIQAWFGPREVSTAERVRNDMAAQSKANGNVARMAHKIDLRNSAWNSPTFFKSRSEGNCVVVELNGNHSLVEKTATARHDNDLSTRQVLSEILAAYHDAKNRFVGPENTSAAEVFDAFEYEWGMILNSYANAPL